MPTEHLEKIAAYIRYLILTSTTKAGAGHPTSSLSATELMTALFFGDIFRYFPDDPDHPNNDRLIFSKGHASPLFYALWAAAGKVSEEEMMTYRQFNSVLEGHPSVRFPYTEAATGSLGQGLPIGVGMAINAKYLDKLPYRTFVLLGDSEMAEGSQWEAIQLAARYELNNLIAVLDVNRLGQRGETMYGYDLDAYADRASAFGWQAIEVADGHSYSQVLDAYQQALNADRPAMIVAHTVKGKGVSFVENENGWHGTALDEKELKRALSELGDVEKSVRGTIAKPEDRRPAALSSEKSERMDYSGEDKVPTRNGYGNALLHLCSTYPNLVSLDGEVCNSTRAKRFRDAHPDRYFEMYIAEQNMVGTAVGLAVRGKIPCVSTFAAFLTRAFDLIRMAQYSDPNIKFIGSHAGVSIGKDGPSQMGLEDIAMMRTIMNGVVVYPCDAVSTERLMEACLDYKGITYLRTTRMGTPIVYSAEDDFPIGGAKVLRQSDNDVVTVIGAGVTVHEALAAYEALEKDGIVIRVIDLYSVKPIDDKTLARAARETRALITVEDHYADGGLGEAVCSALAANGRAPVHMLAVRKRPRSGEPRELLDYEGISRDAIVRKVKELATQPIGTPSS